MRPERRALADMVAAERLPTERAAAITRQRSAAIAAYAFRTTDFYRDLYGSAGFALADVKQPENFDLLPPLTKAHIAEERDRIVSRPGRERDRLAVRTGGSTGAPLLLYNDRSAPMAALWWRIYGWWGVHPSDNSAHIYRQVLTGAAKTKAAVEWWPTRQVVLNARGATEEDSQRFVEALRRLRPSLLVGYVEAVHAFARFVERTRALLPPLTAVSVTASVLHPGQRRYIEDVLRAPVFDTYRSAEVPWIAAECSRRTGLHVLADRRRVDVVDEHSETPLPDGVTGALLVTDFDNRVFPIVRYRVGDRAQRLADVCPCGRSLTRIGPIDGRIADALHSPTGRSVTGGLSGLFGPWPGSVRQFQVHQRADHSIVLRYVPGDDRTRADTVAKAAARALAAMLGDEVAVTAEPVETVEAVAGKARLVVSEVSPP